MGEHIAREKRIFKVLVTYDPPAMEIVDAIWHENWLWLVTAWRENLYEGYRTPVQLIYPLGSQYDRPEGSQVYQVVDYTLRDSIPRSVVDGRARPEEATGFLVKEASDLRFPVPSIH
jgi:hypothetical protein